VYVDDKLAELLTE